MRRTEKIQITEEKMGGGAEGMGIVEREILGAGCGKVQKTEINGR